MKWLPRINTRAVLATLHQDLLGDWYRDPWGWPEIDWLAKAKPSILEARLNGRGAVASSLVDVPKENFATRPASILDPVDRLAYQALIGRASKHLIGKLDPNVFGWRLPRYASARPGRYSRNDKEWQRYRAHLGDLSSRYGAALKTDVVSCFASIPIDRLCGEIDAKLGPVGMGDEAARIISYLDSWNKVPQRGGLPQRCQASSVLANMYLSKCDRVLVDLSDELSELGIGNRSFSRWMDDIWIFGNDSGDLRMAQLEIRQVLSSIGLHLNVAKTKLLEGEAVLEEVLKLEHSAVDEGLRAFPRIDSGPLNKLIERVISEKENANRTSIRFVSERMKTSRRFRKVSDIRDVAHRMPHGADHLGRLFRDSKRAMKMQDWYLDYRSSSWGRMEWPAAQFATMFSSEARRVDPMLIQHLAHELSDSAVSLPLLAVTAQRVAVWDSKLALSAIDNAIQRVSGSLERRVLALAGLNAGAPTSTVRRWLGDFPENGVTLSMLEEMSFKALPYELDFAGD